MALLVCGNKKMSPSLEAKLSLEHHKYDVEWQTDKIAYHWHLPSLLISKGKYVILQSMVIGRQLLHPVPSNFTIIPWVTYIVSIEQSEKKKWCAFAFNL